MPSFAPGWPTRGLGRLMGLLGHAMHGRGVLGHKKSPALQIRAFLNRESSMARGRLHLAGLLYHASREQVRLLRKLVFQPLILRHGPEVLHFQNIPVVRTLYLL